MMVGRCVLAQRDSSAVHTTKNSFFVEFAGNAGIYRGHVLSLFSINYDRIIFDGEADKISIRIGSNIPLKYYSNNINPLNTSNHISTIMVNLLFGSRNVYIECGVGADLIFFNSDYQTSYGAFTSVLGLRYQNTKRGIMAKGGLTPTFFNGNLPLIGQGPYGYTDRPLYFAPLLGGSIGYSF